MALYVSFPRWIDYIGWKCDFYTPPVFDAAIKGDPVGISPTFRTEELE